MSFLTELDALLPKKVRGLDVTLYADWAGFYSACPLSRPMLVKHGPQWQENYAPERPDCVPYYQEKFFGEDGVGIVLSKDGVPVTGLVYRRVAKDEVENTLRLGEPAGNIGIRPLFRQLGIARVSYSIHKQFPSTHAHMERMAALHGCKRTVTEDELYIHYVDELPEDCHGDA